ncbi:MAG TPA: hypothetical protein VJC04_01270 [Candidatus Paceibacterota bacterium]
MNLLPQKEKKENQQEYFYRFSAGLVGTVLISLLIGSFAFFPTYILIKIKRAELKTNLLSLKNPSDLVGDEEVYKILESAGKKVDFLSPQSALPLTAAVIKIVNKKPAGVKIYGVSYHPQESAQGWSVALALTGLAVNREAIASFVKALQTEPSFSSINVPVSNFAKDRNIKFSLTLIQNEK